MNNTMSDTMNGNVNDKGNGNRKSAAPARVIAAGGASLAHFTAARNTCKLCAPLGACFVYKGIEGCVPLLHGSQGCATYIRRYLISHFREPVDIASSSLTESSTVFGGQNDLAAALDNIIRQYSPAIIGIATTCLSETMGEDVAAWLAHYKKSAAGRPLPELIWASTPSYRGSHMQGFHAAVNGAVGHLARGGPKEKRINLFGGLFSCADIRHLHTVMRSYGSAYTIFPDYSETLDGPSWDRYVGIPAGGTPLADMAHMGRAAATIVFGDPGSESTAAAAYLKDSFGVDYFVCDYPIGMDNCNRFHVLLTAITGVDTAECFSGERGRLADAYID
ncbi:MAG: nitrogenase component 1, partial [Spirochaetia bacterium]